MKSRFVLRWNINGALLVSVCITEFRRGENRMYRRLTVRPDSSRPTKKTRLVHTSQTTTDQI